MENKLKLYMIMLGCRPKGRLTEQHDIFFGIANSLKDLIPNIKQFWPEAKGQIHIDVWREVTVVDGYKIEIILKTDTSENENKLFFINLGGYKPNEFEEFHYKMLAVGQQMSDAVKKSKQTIFYKHCGFAGATSHVDDKFGVDVDDLYNVKDILELDLKQKYNIQISKSEISIANDELNIGYLKLEKI